MDVFGDGTKHIPPKSHPQQRITGVGQALVNFRTAIISSDGILQQWRPEDEDPCRWKGVKCDLKSKRVTALSLPNHKLSGPISSDLGKLESLQFLALHDNNLYGAIPPELGNCTQLQSIFLQGNYLSGLIPSELGNLSQLESLDVSSNSLSGSIPASLGKLSKLLKFFVGNRGLCGTQIQICKNDGGGSSRPTDSAQFQAKKNSGRLLISALATVGALLLVALMCFWGCFLYKRLGKNDGKGLAMDVSGELEILGSIKHRYLVNLRGYCNSPTSKLLIYDFLSGGSLDEALHERAEQLDWEARLNIIMGAAKGLAYLHHDCSPRIIHRDIKSSNILLDGNFEARVSDFGLAKLLEDEESHITTIVAGTFGYLAPEYMQSGRATEKTDVYSFGVLVLEIVSGKRPTDASFIEKGLNIVGWLNYLVSENRQREIVDLHCERVQTESLDAILSIAIQCVSSCPEDRPTMHRVVQILESEVMTPCPSDFYDSSSD
ncbi:hypothetical protein DH2020_049313 [Rehmannia glutinosa]|uniref:Protein kinase domain-containing protein n=1 Tax=Rehmannia glutinosa TaxID=99300 RepID=A0ABR0U369_REHGL